MTQTPVSPRWTLRYAPHVGYVPPFEPLFRHLSCGDAIDLQVDFIAAEGFAGVLHPWVGTHPPAARLAFAAKLRERGLEAGCVVYAGFEEIMEPAWVSRDADARRALLGHVEAAAAVAAEIGSGIIAVLVAADPDETIGRQHEALAENLSFAADLAAKHDVRLGLEPMIALPNMLFQSADEAAEVIAKLGHPGTGLIFDTGHVAAMDGDVLAAQARLSDLVCLYQLADAPHRTEPGSGSVDFAALLGRLRQEGYRGLIELEHGWSGDGAAVERDGLATLRALDAGAVGNDEMKRQSTVHHGSGVSR